MPLDTRIALGVQPLQVQFRDPMASYNQLAQLQSADTQNQLAQMQMQEARQLAPLRMQEQQSRAAAAKLTLDEANEAQTYIKSVMAKAAEASGGSAPTDPFEAAKQMMNYPNSQVQAAGLRLLESSQKLIAFENQMANERAYAEEQRGGAPAPVAAALSADNVAAPMVEPGTPAPVGFNTSARLIQPEGKSYADMSNTERIQFDVARIQNPELGQPQAVYTLDGKEVPFREYVNANIANSTFKPDNALAAAVAPAAAPPVNAMAKKAVNPLQDAAALMKQIQDGDDRFARGGTPAPGWKNKRELLMKAFEQAVKVERNQNQRYLSLGAGAALDTETRELIAKDRAPAAAAAPKIFSVRGIPHTLNEEGNLVPVPVEGGALPAAAAVKPQAVAAARIINIKGVPHTLNEEGNLVPVPVEGGASPAAAVAVQPQAAPKITTIKGIPYTFNADTGKFVRVPVEGGLPAAAGKGKTLPSTDASGGVKPAAGVKPLTEAQIIKLRTDVGNDYKNASTALSQINDLLTSATAVKTSPGLSAATGFTGMLPSFPEGAAAQAETRLANLRGKVTALGKATAAMSGAIGSIANQEWKILADQIAVLNEIKGKGPLLEQITSLEEQAKGAAARIRDVYEKTRADDFERFPQFRDLPQPQGKKDSGALTPAEQAELDQLRSRFGKKKP